MPPTSPEPTPAARNEQLFRAVSAYTKRVLDEFRQSEVQLLTRMPITRWVRDPKDRDVYRAVQELGRWDIGPTIDLNDTFLRDLPEYTIAARALADDPDLGPQVGQLVGTSGLRMGSSAWNILNRHVRELVDRTGDLSFDAGEFARVYQRLDESLREQTFTFEAIAPIFGPIEAPHPAIMADTLTIDPITEDDVTRLMGQRLLTPDSFTGELHLSRFVLRKTFERPKWVGVRPEKHSPIGYGIMDLFTQAIYILRLLKSEPIATPGAVFRCLSPWLEPEWASTAEPVPLGVERWRSTCTLSAEDTAQFARLSEALDSPGVTSRPFLDLAVRRIAYSRERHRPEDRLIDLMIAAEALFFTGSETGELSYKLALRVAYFGNTTERSQRFAKMREAYDARSKVVHGSPEAARKLTYPVLTEIADGVDKYLRDALLRLIPLAREHPKGVLVDWDKLVLGTDILDESE